MKIKSRFFDIEIDGVGAAIIVHSTKAHLVLTKDELRELFLALGPLYEDELQNE